MPLNLQDKITHLLRRAGFAARPEEIEAGVARGLAATADQLINFDRIPDNLGVLPTVPKGHDEHDGAEYMSMSEEDFRYVEGHFIEDINLFWLNAMVTTTRPLQEKMVLFWHHLFATSFDGVYDVRQIYLQNENFRGNFNPVTGQIVRPYTLNPFPVGNYRQMLEYLSQDPAMLFWLDNWENHKHTPEVGSNENYARELLELFSLGVFDPVTGEPNYTERDVRQASRALTGWSVHMPSETNADNFPRRFFFNGSRDVHDYGPYHVLGVTFSGDGRRLFDVIVQHKRPGQRQSACGRFLGYRLFKFFGYDDPEPEVINDLADVFDGVHGGERHNIRQMLRRIFTPGNPSAEAFYSEKAFRAHIKSPTEFLVSAYRLLNPGALQLILQNADRDDFPIVYRLPETMRKMGQELFRPPNVGGWKDGVNWINTTLHLSRINMAAQIADARLPQQGGIDVRQLLLDTGLFQGSNFLQARKEPYVDYFTRLLLQTSITPELRQALVQYLNTPASGLGGDVERKKIQGLIFLILTMPAFHLS